MILSISILFYLISFNNFTFRSDDNTLKDESGNIYIFEEDVKHLPILESHKISFDTMYNLNVHNVDGNVVLDSNVFNNGILIKDCFFNDSFIFSGNLISNSFTTSFLSVKSGVYITLNNFRSDFNLRGEFFQDFSSSTNIYEKRALFTKIVFKSKVFFFEDKFGDFLSIRDCIFHDSLYFVRVLLPDTLDFSRNTRIQNEIDFTNLKIKQNKRCLINLVGTDISKIKINTLMFQIWFPPQDSATFEQKTSVYENLLVKFKKDGFNDSFRDIDIEFRDLKYQNAGLSFVGFLERYWWNYGYNKERILFWSVALLLFYSFINSFFLNKLMSHVYSIELISQKNLRHNIFLRYYYSIIYTSLIFFGIKLNIKNFKTTNGWFVYTVIVYLSGLICTAYIINLIVTK